MKKNIFIIVILTLLLNFSVNAEWQDIKILENSTLITSSFIMNDNSIVVLSDRNSIFKSDSQHKNWTCIFKNPSNQHFTSNFSIFDTTNIVFSTFSDFDSFIYKLNCSTKDNSILRHCTANDNALTTYMDVTLDSKTKIYALGGIYNVGVGYIPVLSKFDDEKSEWIDLIINNYPNEMIMNGFISENSYCLVLRNQNNLIRIIKSDDGGETWNEKYYNSNYSGGYYLQFFRDSVGIVTGNNGFLLKTEDGGETWFDIYPDESFKDKTFSSVGVHFFDKDKILLVGKHGSTNRGVVCYSEDGGKKWEILHELEGSSLYSISVKDDKIYCFGRNGMMVKGTINDLPSSISGKLQSNNLTIYPNPSTNQTTLNLELGSACEIKIILCDILGREVKQVYEGFAEAGKFTTNINTDNLAKSTYLLKISIGSEYKVEKFVVE